MKITEDRLWKEKMLKQLESEQGDIEWSVEMGRKMKEARLIELKKKGIFS